MQCDRAQEFFSDYLEKMLDRPMTVALESHLVGCADCREEIETLQHVFLKLDSLPDVDPPVDGAWQILARLRSARADQWEAERDHTPSFLGWLRSLHPARVAMASGLATLVVAGAVVMSGPFVEQMRIFGPTGNRPDAPAPVVAQPVAPVSISYGPVTAEGQQVNLRIAPAASIADPVVQVKSLNTGALFAHKGEPGRTNPILLPIILPAGQSCEVLRVTVAGALSGSGYRHLVVVPLGQQATSDVTQILFDQPVEETLKRIAVNLDRPVVIEHGVTTRPITLQVDGEPVHRVLEQIARQLNGRLHVDAGFYRIIPQQ